MYILLWILFGAIIGWLASIISKKNARMGLIANIIVGLIGAFIGSLIASLLDLGSFQIFTLWSFVFSVLGAVIFLWLLTLFKISKR